MCKTLVLYHTDPLIFVCTCIHKDDMFITRERGGEGGKETNVNHGV